MEAGLIYIAIGFALGGILKGATGAGAPIVAIPLMAIFYDVPFAVAVFVVPTLAANLWQVWKHRSKLLPALFVWRFAGIGALGTAFGTAALAAFSSEVLKLFVAFTVLIYIAFRMMNPTWKLGYGRALFLSVPVGGLAGILQGASGVSAPVSITFLNAMRLEREVFMPTISAFFLATVLVQIPMLTQLGFLTWERLWLSCVATLLLLAFMPVGSALAKRFSRENFDKVILILLGVLSCRLVYEVLF